MPKYTPFRLQVTCVGQVIGAIVADTQAHAQRAAHLVKVEYEDIRPVIVTTEVNKLIAANVKNK